MTITENKMASAAETFVTNVCKAAKHEKCPGSKGPWDCSCSCHTTTKTGESAEGASDEVKPENAAADMSGELQEQNIPADDAPEPTPNVEGQGDEEVAAAAVSDGPVPTFPVEGDRGAMDAGSGRKPAQQAKRRGPGASTQPSSADHSAVLTSDTLDGDFAAPSPAMRFDLVPLDHVVPSIDNPRRDLGDLDSLVASIKAVGIIEPLIVEWCEQGEDPDHWVDDAEPHFHLIAGHRREKAARMAGLTEVPCLIRQPVADDARLELMLIENLQRADLVPLDEANGYRRLVELGMSQRTIADRVGCSQSHVSKRLSLLELPAFALKQIDSGGITLEDAHHLLKLKDRPETIGHVLKQVKQQPWYDVERAVEHAKEELEVEARVKVQRDEAASKGWAVVERSSSGRSTFLEITTSDWGGIQVDKRKHRNEPCHAVVIDRWGRKFTEVCADPSRHGSKGASTLKAKVPARSGGSSDEAKRRTEQKLKKAAGARRVEFVRPILAKKPTAAIVAPLLAEAVIDELHYDGKRIAAAMLGLPGGTNVEHRSQLKTEAAKSPGDLLRVALACALARGDMHARESWHTWEKSESVTALYRFLLDAGYELDGEYEAKHVKLPERAEA